MKYPKLRELPTTRELVDVFKGYNHNPRIGDGEFYDMKNLSSDFFPVLATRPPRGVFATLTKPQGIISKGVLCYVDGEDFVLKRTDGETRVAMGFSLDETPKKMTSIGAYVIIMPDKKYINVENTEDRGSIEYSIEFESGEHISEFHLCDKEGRLYFNIATQNTAPENPNDGDLWMQPREDASKLFEYSSQSKSWVNIIETYVKISCPNIEDMFEEGDNIQIEGLADELSLLNTIHKVVKKEYSSIVVEGFIEKQVVSYTDYFKITKRIPNMDFIIESGNRLWGCRSGKSVTGETVNEIYASKLGDFKIWDSFRGISTDSFTASVGSDGAFTGAVSYLGYPIFFKENCVHKILGSYPANYQIQTTDCRGVQHGCDRSLAIVNEIIYYKSRSGICAYDGSFPIEISSCLGEAKYYNAVAGTLGNKYYISMSDKNGRYSLFVYDTAKGLWHKEDETQAIDFCSFGDDLFYIEYADNQIKSVRGTGTIDTTPIKWEAVTGIIGTDSPDKKYVSRMDVRMSLSVEARVSFYAEYDSSGEWEYLCTMSGENLNLRTFAVPIKPKRCDHFKLKILGNGEAKIFSICKTTEQGSDV